jgi:tRNA uridine 5-carbamoylmethylation protein Kti12
VQGGDRAGCIEVVRQLVEDILRRPETYGENPRWDRCTFVITDESGALVMTVPFSEFAP